MCHLIMANVANVSRPNQPMAGTSRNSAKKVRRELLELLERRYGLQILAFVANSPAEDAESDVVGPFLDSPRVADQWERRSNR